MISSHLQSLWQELWVNFALFQTAQNYALVLIIIAFLICFVVIRYRFQKNWITGLSRLWFLVGGAAENAIDRFFHGAVVDFLNVLLGISNLLRLM